MANKICQQCNEEYTGKVSSMFCGRKCYADFRRGTKRSCEAVFNMSKSLTGRKLSEEHKNNISKGLVGRFVSEETREKISKSKKGRKMPENVKRKLLEANWKGDNATRNTGHQRAQRLIEANVCERCGRTKEETMLHRHHIDENSLNNSEENIEILCAKCHVREHRKRRKETCHL